MIQMGNIKKLSVNDLRQVVGISNKQCKQVQWHARSVTVKQFLTIGDYLETIRSILKDCETREGGFAFELVDFSMRAHIISSYAFVELPDDMDELFYFVYASGLYETIYKASNQNQIDSIRSTVRFMIGSDNCHG